MYSAAWACYDLLTGLQPTPHLLLSSLSLSLSISLFAAYRGEEEDQSYWQQPWSRMEWGGVWQPLAAVLPSLQHLFAFPFIFCTSIKHFSILFLPTLSLTHAQTQNLTWNLQVALSGSEVLKVEVYDHETVGRNRYYIILLYAQNQEVHVLQVLFLRLF